MAASRFFKLKTSLVRLSGASRKMGSHGVRRMLSHRAWEGEVKLEGRDWIMWVSADGVDGGRDLGSSMCDFSQRELLAPQVFVAWGIE